MFYLIYKFINFNHFGKTQAVDMAYYLLRHEGIFVGPSAALNVVGAVKAARQMPKGSVIVTILCDSGDRYVSKMYNKDWLEEENLMPHSIEDESKNNLSFVKEINDQ